MGRAQKIKKKLEGKILGVLYSALAESPLGNWEGFQKSSLIGFSLKKVRILSKRGRRIVFNTESRPSGAFLCSKISKILIRYDSKKIYTILNLDSLKSHLVFNYEKKTFICTRDFLFFFFLVFYSFLRVQFSPSPLNSNGDYAGQYS